jgi:hypothetical protein
MEAVLLYSGVDDEAAPVERSILTLPGFSLFRILLMGIPFIVS